MTFRQRCTRPRIRGFTVVEMLITITIASLVIGSMVAFFLGQVRSARLADSRIEAIQRARFAADMLRREISLAGSGMPNAQPLVVYAGPDDIVLSSDLRSSIPGDRIALYVVPSAPLIETEGADSGTVLLPNGQQYPDAWYGGGVGLAGPAETIRFSFVPQPGGNYALVRSVNDATSDTILRDVLRTGGADFFHYELMDRHGLRSVGSGPIWHAAPIHDSPADTGQSAQADSIKLVHIDYTVEVRARRAQQTVQRDFALAVSLKNAGLVHNASCGDPPLLGVTPTVTAFVTPQPRVDIRWAPAQDERGGEADVFQYTLYRRKATDLKVLPIASMPPDKNLATYLYQDTDVALGETYIYYLGATDCTPLQSTLSQSNPVPVI